MLVSFKRIVIFVAVVITLILFYTAPAPSHDSKRTPEEDATESLTPKSCPEALNFGNITADKYFVFVKPRYGDGTIFSNMCFYLGLKYHRYFALNTETPLHWYGLNTHLGNTLQITKEHPTVICSEQCYSSSGWRTVLPHYQSVKHLVLGFVRDPTQVFLSCLLQKVRYRRRNSANDVSIMLDTNVANYMKEFEGNLRQDQTYMDPTNCNNHLSFILGLSDDKYRQLISQEDEGVHVFADEVLENIDDFIIYEHVEESTLLFLQENCLTENMSDYLFFNQIPEKYTGLGFGEMKQETRDKLKDFLKYDYEIYTRVLRRFHERVQKKRQENDWSYNRVLETYKDKLTVFKQFCVEDKLSLNPDESKARKNELTLEGVEDIQCRVIHSSNALLSNIVIQIQASGLTDVVSGVFNEFKGQYTRVLQIISASLTEDEESDTKSKR